MGSLAFTGISSYSDDFQTILDKAVSVASVPIQRLQNEQSDIVQKKMITSSLQSGIQAVADDLRSLVTVADNKAVAAVSSDTSKVVITSTSSASPATYEVKNIQSIAKTASETSVQGYADSSTTAVSTSGTIQLTVGTKTFSKTLGTGENNLVAIRNWINQQNAGVTATILTTGTANYLSVSANTSGATALKLEDMTGTPANLMTTANQGSDAVFSLNGVQVTKKSNLINDVVPGVSFEIKATSGATETTTIRLSSDRSKLKNALSSMVTNYNSLVDNLDAQIGENAGVLTGDVLVREIGSVLREMSQFTGTGVIKSIADLGLELTNTGKLKFIEKTFDALSDTQISDAFSFLATSGSGPAGVIKRLEQFSDPTTGLIKVQQDKYDDRDDQITTEISDITDEITAMRAGLASKLQIADTMLASLESQQRVLDASLQSLNLVLYGKKE